MHPTQAARKHAAERLPGLPELLELKTALVIAHPGHECRIMGWVEKTRPRVSVLTDGSGRDGRPRIRKTDACLRAAGATTAPLFGAATDRNVYQAVLDLRMEFFEDLTQRLAESLVRDRVEMVFGDSAEGEIMVHDLFREVRRAAVRLAEQTLGYSIHHFEFPLESHPLAVPAGYAGQTRRLRLSDAEFRRKMDTARGYEQIAPFVDAALEAHGELAFAVESIFPVTEQSLLPQDRAQPLPYEQHGRRQCQLGHYRQSITWSEHLRPIAEHLADVAVGGTPVGQVPYAGAA